MFEWITGLDVGKRGATSWETFFFFLKCSNGYVSLGDWVQSSSKPQTYHFSGSPRYFDLRCLGSACLSAGLKQMWNDSLLDEVSEQIVGFLHEGITRRIRRTVQGPWQPSATRLPAFRLPTFDRFNRRFSFVLYSVCNVCIIKTLVHDLSLTTLEVEWIWGRDLLEAGINQHK